MPWSHPVGMVGFRGIYRSDHLAALNALFVDLNWHKLPAFQGKDRGRVVKLVRDCIARDGLSEPSILLSTGEGHALIWLIHEMPPAAERRWCAALRTLIGPCGAFGADPTCCDVNHPSHPASTLTPAKRSARDALGRPIV